MSTMSSEAIRALEDQWESLGEPEVRRLLPLGVWGELKSDMRLKVEDWLRSKEVEREAASVSIAREEASAAREAASAAREANEIARSALATASEALRIARQQRILDVITTIMATLAIVIAIIK